MNVPPSRSSQNSRPSTVSSSLSSFPSPSPRPLSSALSTRSEDSLSDPKLDPPPHLDCLLPCVTTLLAKFDKVNQAIEEVYQMEVKLEDIQIQKRASRIQKDLEKLGDSKPKKLEEEIRRRRSGILYPNIWLSPSIFFNQSSVYSYANSAIPRTRKSYSESESFPLYKAHRNRAAKPASFSCSRSMSPATGFEPPPRRRAWHSGSSHSADAAQRILQSCVFGKDNLGFGRPMSEDGARRSVTEGIPVKRKAWISEGAESEE